MIKDSLTRSLMVAPVAYGVMIASFSTSSLERLLATLAK